MIYKTVLVFVFVVYLASAQEGDSCDKKGTPGVCVNIRSCRSAIEDLRKRINPQICSFIGVDPVVCCVDGAGATTTGRPAVISTSRKPAVTSTPYIPVYDNANNDGSSVGCEALSPQLTSPKTGQKAFDKCVEYQQSLIYPCKRVETGDVRRANYCHHNADELIVGVEPAKKDEFPHMVLLGYGDDIATVQWLCGGSLISENFVLSAGHCIVHREKGEVSYALMGALKRSDPINSELLRRVKRHISHPEYKLLSRYHDIALIELVSPVKLSPFVVPACVHAGDRVADAVLGTGWGLAELRWNASDVLQKVNLYQLSSDECAVQFPVHRHMRNGFDANTQTCYVDKQEKKDTCLSDRGGPIQIKSKKLHCMYVVTGVTSFGWQCRTRGEPGIYTRVSHYLDWIEKTVWPN